jgi:hypothetical protein
MKGNIGGSMPESQISNEAVKAKIENPGLGKNIQVTLNHENCRIPISLKG